MNAPYGFRQLTGFLESQISRSSTNQRQDGILLAGELEWGNIQLAGFSPSHIAFLVRETLRESA